MRKALWISLAVLFVAIGASKANADTVTYGLTYTDVAGGPSFGVGQVTIDSAVLTPSNSVFTNAPTSFIDAFSLTFSNFPNNGPITFTLANLGAAFISTDSSSQIVDFNFWSYDRIGLGTNTCATCTVPYLAGVDTFTGTVTDPVNNNTLVEYTIALTPVATPEPSVLLMLGMGLLGLVAVGRSKLC
jgi:hypothetical protein